MGVTYIKDKPENEDFAFAYVEADDGSLVRVSKAKMREALGIEQSLKATNDGKGNVTLTVGHFVTNNN